MHRKCVSISAKNAILRKLAVVQLGRYIPPVLNLRTAADPAKVILMPEGVESGVLRERGQWLAEIRKLEGFRFSPRLHVELWGNRRGV